MIDLLEKLRPPGYDKPNRKAVYRVIARSVGVLSDDARRVLYAFFPAMASSKELADGLVIDPKVYIRQ